MLGRLVMGLEFRIFFEQECYHFEAAKNDEALQYEGLQYEQILKH